MSIIGIIRSVFLFCCFLLCGCSANLALSEKIYRSIQYPEHVEAEQFWQDKEFGKRFAEYWGMRFENDTSGDLFKMEVPYFQEMVGLESYKVYMQNAGQNDLIDISVYDIEFMTDYLAKVKCAVRFKMPDGKTGKITEDEWVYVDTAWYHIIRDRLVFPDAT